ncbi:hypothetical protein SAMN05421787_10517 [Virgibacillus pantothenticus]|nr:hypothetical protein SAMN05421787_10517 [Virgibacillus pantothenticus]
MIVTTNVKIDSESINVVLNGAQKHRVVSKKGWVR